MPYYTRSAAQREKHSPGGDGELEKVLAIQDQIDRQSKTISPVKRQIPDRVKKSVSMPLLPAISYGPINIFESVYYNPAAPGSYGGINALQRSIKSSYGPRKSKREIQEWFESQPTYNLHKPVRKRFKRNVILVHGVDEQFQADLADMSMLSRYNDGVHFLLVCIDVLSKYLWVIPVRNKSAPVILEAFQRIFSERKPMKLQTDLGTEFTNVLVREHLQRIGVQQFYAWNPDIKAAIAERVIKTLKQKIWRYLTHTQTSRYVDVLPQLVHSYNNTYHRSIKMTPTEASRPENTKKVWENLYGSAGIVTKGPGHNVRFKYQPGDYVRISEERGVFKKGYKQGWSNEIFRVTKQSARDPVVYRLEDLSGEPIIGSFYEAELQKVSAPIAAEINQFLQSAGRDKDRRDIDFYINLRGYPAYRKNEGK